ncbi:MAG: MFS transporter [Anaerolineae bacterium]|nr:MFS transporter [Anaerolineae bacterium]
MQKKPRFAALQHADFRWLWIGSMISVLGNAVQNTAIHWQIFELLKHETVKLTLFGQTYELGEAALGLGGIGLARIVPIVFFALLGGAVADAFDRRKILIASSFIAGGLSIFLAILSFTAGHNLLLIYLVTSGIAATNAFGAPARQALIPNLVPRQDLTNALSLGSMVMNVGQIGGPALGGLIVAELGAEAAYVFNAISFLAVIFAVLIMKYRKVEKGATSRVSLSAMADGFRFVRNERIIFSTMLLDFFATFFSSAQTMLPIMAGQYLGLGARGFGILATGQAVGALIAGTIVSYRGSIQRQGQVLLGAVIVYGLATALFGLTRDVVLAYIFYAMTGAADAVSTVIRGTVRQLLTPDHMRGRMVGVNMMFFQGGPQLGELEAGAVAAVFGVPASIVSGGIITVLLTLWVAVKFPKLREYRQ